MHHHAGGRDGVAAAGRFVPRSMGAPSPEACLVPIPLRAEEIAVVREIYHLFIHERRNARKQIGAPGKAWMRRKRCRRKPKPHKGPERATEPVRQRLTTSRKRVLRGRTTGRLGRKAAKRRQRANRPCDGAPKFMSSWKPTFLISRKAAPTRREAARPRPCREMRHRLSGESRRQQRLPRASVVLKGQGAPVPPGSESRA